MKTFVVFISATSLFNPQLTREVPAIDLAYVEEIYHSVKKLTPTPPYAFRFCIEDGDRNKCFETGVYYINGSLRTRDQVEKDNLPGEEHVVNNMIAMGCSYAVLVEHKPHSFVVPFYDCDYLVTFGNQT